MNKKKIRIYNIFTSHKFVFTLDDIYFYLPDCA